MSTITLTVATEDSYVAPAAGSKIVTQRYRAPETGTVVETGTHRGWPFIMVATEYGSRFPLWPLGTSNGVAPEPFAIKAV